MKDSGNIKVIEPTDDFKRIHKSIIRNKNIDCLTLGIYCKIVVLGADWQLNIKGLSKILGVSDNKVRASIGILEREGYIKREANYHDNKLDGWVYNVYPEPLKDEERSRAGYKKNNDDLQIQCCAESSVTQNQTTLESDITENGKDNNIRPNIIEDLKNNKTNNKEKDNKLSSKKAKEFVPPTVEEVKAYIKERGYHFDAKSFVEYYESDDWHYGEGKKRRKVSNWKRCCTTWENTWKENHGGDDLFEQAEKNKREELLLKSFYDILGSEEAVIYGIDPNVWYTMDEKAKNYHRAQPQKKEKLLKWIREHDNG